MVGKFMTIVWIFSKRMNVGSVFTIFHGVFLGLSLPLHLSSIFLILFLLHAPFLFLLTSDFLAHLLVLLLLSKIFISMIHSVVLMHRSMVSHVMMSQWGCIMMELVGIVSHSTKEAVVLLTVVLFLLELLEKSVGCKVLIGLSGIDNAG